MTKMDKTEFLNSIELLYKPEIYEVYLEVVNEHYANESIISVDRVNILAVSKVKGISEQEVIHDQSVTLSEEDKIKTKTNLKTDFAIRYSQLTKHVSDPDFTRVFNNPNVKRIMQMMYVLGVFDSMTDGPRMSIKEIMGL